MKPTGRLLYGIVLVTLIAACSGASGPLGPVPSAVATPSPSVGPTVPDQTPAPSETPPPSSEPTSSPQGSPGAGTMIVRTYFYLGGAPDSAGLVPLLREVPGTKAVATAAMNALLAGPTPAESGDRAITTAIATGSRLLRLTIKDTVATVDLSSEFESGGGGASANIRLGQVVYTLTQFSTVSSVVFQIEGRTVTVFGSEGIVLDGPVTRADYVSELPGIFVDRPAFGAALGNPGRVSGSAQTVFEATFRITLFDGAGKTVADQQVMAACMCASGSFEATVAYDVPKAQWGMLRVWAGSAKDGSPILVRQYPIWLTPAG